MDNKNWIVHLFTQQIFTDHQLRAKHVAGDTAVNIPGMVLAFVDHTGPANWASWWPA